ncbi:hypothetical protein HDZ31DRAFT_80820 [Schizophyllum fasciatum]
MSSPKVWMITGANSGLGLAISRYVSSHGQKVIACARDTSRIPQSLAAAVTPYALDLNWPASQIKAAVAEAEKLHGRIDVLVNNAGYCVTGAVEELDPDDIEAQFRTNVFGQISAIQGVLPTMKRQKAGHIINISSIAGFAGGPPFGAYNASKAALDAFTESLATEVAKFGITAITVSPGYFPTNFLATASLTDKLPEDTQYPEYAGATAQYTENHRRSRQVGDASLAAARLFEIVNGSGAVKWQPEWRRLPLGPDSGKRTLAKLEQIRQNVESLEPVWSSTDMTDEHIDAFYEQKRWKE